MMALNFHKKTARRNIWMIPKDDSVDTFLSFFYVFASFLCLIKKLLDEKTFQLRFWVFSCYKTQFDLDMNEYKNVKLQLEIKGDENVTKQDCENL